MSWRKAIVVPLAFVLALIAQAAKPPHDAPVLPLQEIRPGMEGEVWTVFTGTEPEPFKVRVTGVVVGALGPQRSLILCELTDPKTEKMGAVAGMSGSPLYIDGKFAGALSYQLQRFETVRFAGFTPAADLFEVRAYDDPPASSVKTTEGTLAPLSIPFTASGVSPGALQALTPEFEALGMSLHPLGGYTGQAGGGSPGNLVPGSAVAVALTDGDLSIAGTGTVSHVEGDRIIAFGHPMLGLGRVKLPMAAADIVAILPSLMSSFKVSNTGSLIGTITQDRLSAISGTVGPIPAMIPVTITAPERTLRYTAVRHPRLTPPLIALGLMQAVQSSNLPAGAEGFVVNARIHYPGDRTLAWENWYDGPQGLNSGIAVLIGRLALPMQGPFDDLLPDRVDLTVRPIEEDPSASLDNLQLSRGRLIPGETLEATLSLRPFKGPALSETVQIPIREEWAGRRLDLIVVNGPFLERLSGKPDNLSLSQVRSIDALIEWQRTSLRDDGAYIAIVERASGLLEETTLSIEPPGSFERITRQADDARYSKRELLVPLWSQHVFPGRLFDANLRRSLQIQE